jgi:hypothetical protein
MLMHGGNDPMPLARIRELQRDLRGASLGEKRYGEDKINLLAWGAGLHPQLGGDPKSPTLRLSASSLFAYMVAEIALKRAGGARFVSCLHCGTFFVVGAGVGKRRGSMYCGPTCVVRAHRERQRASK